MQTNINHVVIDNKPFIIKNMTGIKSCVQSKVPTYGLLLTGHLGKKGQKRNLYKLTWWGEGFCQLD